MPKKYLPLLSAADITQDWNIDVVNEARDFIKKTLVEYCSDCEFTAGYSGGKDSTILLQLIYEACNELGGDYLKRLTVFTSFTRYELDFQREHLLKNIEMIEKSGVNIEKAYCYPEWSYGVVTLGVGVWSLMTTRRYCNRMKSSQLMKYCKSGTLQFSGTRAEESSIRKKQERIGKYEQVIVARPLRHFLECDVWGYLRHIGKTFWGETYEDLKTHYENSGSRDGCWVCPFHKNTNGYRPIQKECIERLDWLRGVNIRQKNKRLKGYETRSNNDYPGRTLPMPLIIDGGYVREYWYMLNFSRSCIRPINVCMLALDRVLEMERRYNDTLLHDFERPIIKDIHTLRSRYDIHIGKKWMLNPDYWCGRHLLDLDPITREVYSKYRVPPAIMNRCNGDWFGRYAIEYERKDILETIHPDHTDLYHEEITALYKGLCAKMKEVGYTNDVWTPPVPGLFDNDPGRKPQDQLKMEIIARTWNKK